jgi:hypothetical protein
MFSIPRKGSETEFREILFPGTAGIPSEITICSVNSVFRGIIFLSEIPNPTCARIQNNIKDRAGKTESRRKGQGPGIQEGQQRNRQDRSPSKEKVCMGQDKNKEQPRRIGNLPGQEHRDKT